MRVLKRTNVYRCVLLAIVIVCLSLIGSFCLRDTQVVSASEGGYKTIYVGDVIEAADYTVSYAGGGAKAEGLTAVYPSGGVYGGKSFIVEQAGNYEVTYYATVKGSRVENTERYVALRQSKDLLYSTDGATIGYGKFEVPSSPYPLTKQTYGAMATFKAGTSVVFSTTIPTEKLTADYNIIDMIVVPSVFKETDFERLTVVITDAQDADNYVEVVINSSNAVDGDGQVSYVRAGANGQQIGGYEGSTYHTMGYGTQVEHSFRGLGRSAEDRKNVTLSEQSITIALDHAERKVYCGPMTYIDTSNFMVNDLDDPANYKGNPWGGFTSDEVTVKLVASAFTKASGTVLVKSFGDYNLSKDIVDELAPQITVQCVEDEPLPIATVGMEFPILPFTVKDALDTKVHTDVYVYYLASETKKINVSNNGKSFIPKYVGEYEIVYRAEDYSGNVSEASVVISAGAKAPQIFMSLGEEELSAKVYDTVEILEAANVKVFGGHGYLQVERDVYSPSGARLDVEDTLLLTELGAYKVVYKASDYLGAVQYGVVTVNAEATEKPTFVEAPFFDKVLIKGFRYTLTQPLVIEVDGDKVVSLPSTVYINGEAVTGDSFVADGETVEIKYVAEGVSGVSELAISRTVVDTEQGKYQSRYFQAEGDMQAIDAKDYVELAFTGASSVEFIKELYTRGFSFEFSYEKEVESEEDVPPTKVNTANFNSMTVILTDATNRGLSVVLNFTYDIAENAWMLQVNGKGSKVAFATGKAAFKFTYSYENLGIMDNSGILAAKIKEYTNGEPFNGFSQSVYFRLAFDGVTEASSIRLTKLCNQVLGHKKSDIEYAKDDIRPVIFLNEEFQIRQQLGSEAKIPTATAYDVLGQISSLTVTVKNAAGNTLVSGSATESVKLTLSEAGTYEVFYKAVDSNGKSTEISYILYVYDETAPTLTVNGSLRSEYKIGDKISIPTYSATDNNGNYYVQVELILPNNEVRLLQYNENGVVTSLLSKDNELYNNSFKADDNTFIVEEAGEYILRFVAYDEYYNCIIKQIIFKVS